MSEPSYDQELLAECHRNRVNVAIVTGFDDTGEFQMGVRLTPWKQDTRSPRMILARADSLLGALDVAASIARTGKWEKLDYASRPWKQSSVVARWGE